MVNLIIFQDKNKTTLIGLISVVFITTNSVVHLVNEYIIARRNPDEFEKQFDDYNEDPYDDIVKETIPFVRNWYRDWHQEFVVAAFKNGEKAQTLLASRDNQSEAMWNNLEAVSSLVSNGTTTYHDQTDCYVRWLSQIEPYVNLNGVNRTRVDQVLTNMGLHNNPLIQSHIDNALPTKNFSEMMQGSLNCLGQSALIMELACTAEQHYPSMFQNLSFEQQEFLTDAMHSAFVWDILTQKLVDDFASLHYVAQVMKTTQRRQYESYIDQHYQGATNSFLLDKYHGVTRSMEIVATILSSNIKNPPFQANLQINILEAVKLDLENENYDNARVGLALAVAVKFDPIVNDHKLTWRLSQEWVEAYIAWNMVFVIGSVRINVLPKLMIPSVSCTLQSDYGEDFIVYRVLSLAFALMQSHPPLDIANLEVLSDYYNLQNYKATIHGRQPLAIKLGKINLNHVKLPNPNHDEIEEMFYNLCAGECRESLWKTTGTSSFEQYLDDVQFRVFLGLVIWVTVMFTGFGLEVFVFLQLQKQGTWSDAIQSKWTVAQILFPFLNALTFLLAVHQNSVALLFQVVGLWKFGFPETFSYLYNCLYCYHGNHNEFWKLKLQKGSDLLNGIGTVIHHSAASIIITMLCVGVIIPRRDVIAPLLYLVLQHCFAFLEQVNLLLYVVVELVLEVEFEREVIAQLEYLIQNHWVAALGGSSMLVGHWLYLLAGALSLVSSLFLFRKNDRVEDLV